ncbi:MAG: L,D-transpeptidase family protein [Sporomusaceae bacterium]|nr:L,D-transpeptidase family protein [Sporomusaceae bacterium]
MIFIRVVILLLLLVFPRSPSVFAQLNPEMAAPSIIINLPSRTLELYSSGNLVKVYPIAIGKPSTPSPLGNFQITNKEVDPPWIHPRTGNVVPSGPDNPLGYRWMEFTPLYGIHGTNAPWAIGLAVSNGCIRMHEENAEELFDIVSYGTPVQITYDRVKVRIEGNGELSIGIYPDIYGRHHLSLNEVKNQLISYGAGDFLTDNELIELMNEEADSQIVFARFHTIRVNRKTLSNSAFTHKDTVYIPVNPVAAALGVHILWDNQNGLVHGDKRSVPGYVINNQIVTTGKNAHILFGGQQLWNAEENVFDIDMLTVLLNDRQIIKDVQVVDGILAVPMINLANAMNQKVIRRVDGEYWLKEKKVPVSLIGSIPYIQITKIYDIFQAYVYWNQESRSIELTYPFRAK